MATVWLFEVSGWPCKSAKDRKGPPTLDEECWATIKCEDDNMTQLVKPSIQSSGI